MYIVENNLKLYSTGEERFNGISHLLGCVLSLVFYISILYVMSGTAGLNEYTAIGVYAFSMAALYLMSTLYHLMPCGRAKQFLRIMDHCTIFLLIAGCYTPFCMIAFRNQPFGRLMLAAEWILALVGIILNLIDMNSKPIKIYSQISYVVMGWMVILVFNRLIESLSAGCILWLLFGGIAYTVGIVFFALGAKKKYMHCIWHVFVLAGSIFQFISIFMLIISR